MIEKLPEIQIHSCAKINEKLNEVVDAVNKLLAVLGQYETIYNEDIVPMLTPQNETPPENVQKDTKRGRENVLDDHYWFEQQERYKAALVLIRDLTGAGLSYHDMYIEQQEIAAWALDPSYKPLLIGRYNKDATELFDVLRKEN